LNMYWIIIV